jgi:hypothetical protein
VAEEGAMKDEPYFAPIDEATRTKASYRKQKK